MFRMRLVQRTKIITRISVDVKDFKIAEQL